MAALVVVALILGGVFWYSARTTLFGDPDPEPTATPAAEMLTPIPLQRLEQVTEDVQKNLDAAQERLNQAQEALEQP